MTTLATLDVPEPLYRHRDPAAHSPEGQELVKALQSAWDLWIYGNTLTLEAQKEQMASKRREALVRLKSAIEAILDD